MDESLIFTLAVVGVVGVALLVIVIQGQERMVAWRVLAEPLGLRIQGDVLLGELDGVTVRIGMEMHQVRAEGSVQFCVVYAKVPGELPRGFVAAPRRWTSGLSRMMASNLFESGDPALDEMYLFQSDTLKAGQEFVGSAQTQQALRSLIGPHQTGFVEKGRVGIASVGLITDVEEARRELDTVVRAARLLARPSEP